MLAISRESTGISLFVCESVASIFRCFENPDLTTVLLSMIERSALPLISVEVDFAVDASGFSSSVYDSWFKHKWGRKTEEAQWGKAHVICGVKTNIITTAAVTSGISNDSPHLAPFVEATAENFPIRKVSADKAYLSRKNLRAVDAVGVTAYIPFKSTSGLASKPAFLRSLLRQNGEY